MVGCVLEKNFLTFVYAESVKEMGLSNHISVQMHKRSKGHMIYGILVPKEREKVCLTTNLESTRLNSCNNWT